MRNLGDFFGLRRAKCLHLQELENLEFRVFSHSGQTVLVEISAVRAGPSAVGYVLRALLAEVA